MIARTWLGGTNPITFKIDDSDPSGTASGQALRTNWLFLVELSALIALTIADAFGLVPLSQTPFLLLLCWTSLRFRRLAWRDIGLRRAARLARAITLGILVGLAIELLAINITTPWIASITGTPPDLSDFRDLIGNLQLLLLLLFVSWILAAVGEELAFRGYLMNRFAETLNGTRGAWVASLVLVSIYFGIGHSTQGITGIVQESLSGFWLGVLFLASGRNLTVPIIAHGVSNTLALLLIYLNRYPGLS
jgi:uncharacterized protein